MSRQPNTVLIALGSSIGNKEQNLKNAQKFLDTISDGALKCSSIWETDPVGPSKNTFFNAVIALNYALTPAELIVKLKQHEENAGRDLHAERWSDRVIDLDIIAFGNKVYNDADLEIPHKLYKTRLFVLEPLREIFPNWIDPESGDHIVEIIQRAAPLRLSKTSVKW